MQIEEPDKTESHESLKMIQENSREIQENRKINLKKMGFQTLRFGCILYLKCVGNSVG